MNTIFFKNHKKKSVKSVIQTPSYGIIIKVISNNVNYERINNKHNLNEHAFDKEVSNEISIQNKCAEHNIAPPILLSKKTGPHEYKIIMRKMQFTLHDYLKKFLNKKNYMIRPQVYWLRNFEGKINLDYIGRFEEIEKVFIEISKYLLK